LTRVSTAQNKKGGEGRKKRKGSVLLAGMKREGAGRNGGLRGSMADNL